MLSDIKTVPTCKLLATDQQGSVLHSVASSESKTRAYSPYGFHPTDSGLTSLLGFNGEPFDPVTRCYHLGNGYRVFHPILMRFNSPDSWSPFGDGGMNCYEYCGGDPINFADSTGHTPSLSTLIKTIVRLKQLGKNAKKAIIPPTLKNTGSRSVFIGEAKITTGAIDEVFTHGAPFVTQTTERVSGGKLATQLKNFLPNTDESRVLRLVSCYSAYGGKHASQAQRVADKLQRPVIGYHGKVTGMRNNGQHNHQMFHPQSGLAKLRTHALNTTFNTAVSPFLSAIHWVRQ